MGPSELVRVFVAQLLIGVNNENLQSDTGSAKRCSLPWGVLSSTSAQTEGLPVLTSPHTASQLPSLPG